MIPAAARCYTIAQILERVQMNKRTFFHLRQHGKLPWLEELKPRAGRLVRYRADLVDRYLAGEWAPNVRAFASHRRAR